MKKILSVLSLFLTMFLIQPVYADDYNYVSQEKVKEWISSGSPVSIVDIQVEKEFNDHHLVGSIATYSYPVKSDADKAKLDKAVAALKNESAPIVVVCPRGKGGAKRCYDYMKAEGIAEDRLLILEKGMAGWSNKDLVEKK